MTIIFVVRFNVEKNRESYKHFIEDLRYRLRAGDVHDRPVLPPQQSQPSQWFEIVLFTNSESLREIRLRIRVDNLYLDGYQMGSSGHWLEFGSSTANPPPSQLIDGSSFLGFEGGYPKLQNAARQRRENIPLGGQPLINAVNQLYDTTDRVERARSLTVVIQMICESIRFDRISTHLTDTFNGTLDEYGRTVYMPAPGWMQLLETSWEGISEAVQHADADGDYVFPRWAADDMVIATARGALDALGILLFVCFRDYPARRVRRMTISDDQCFRLGQPLVEVFSVRINNIDKEDPGQLYGTIVVNDVFGSQHIYNRESNKYESISPGEYASLIGPDRGQCISALGSFIIDLDLRDHDSLSSDDQICKDQIPWNVYNVNNEYDNVLSCTIEQEKGSVTVNYAVLRDAVQALIKITLINGDDDAAEVYGRIIARNSNFRNDTVLFSQTSDDYVSVTREHPIPLSRSVVAVPVNSSLAIRAKLYDHDTISRDDEIADDFVLFNAQPSGTSEGSVSGKYGEIKVNVTWG